MVGRKLKKAAVVGIGLAGCVSARELADRGYKVHCFEVSDEVGGLCSDEFTEEGYYQKFGPHILHTDNLQVVSYLDRFGDLRKMSHRVCIIPDSLKQITVPYPISMETYEILRISGIDIESALLPGDTFENVCRRKFGSLMYEKVIKVNTERSWYPMKVSEVPVEVASRIALSNDIELFGNNKVVGVPYKGWSDLLRNMIDQESITIQYRTLVDIEYIEKNLLGKYDIVVITSPIFGNPDDYTYRIFSECKYIPGLESRYVDDYVCINNSNKDLDFTRITRFSKFPVESRGDRVGVEYPTNRFTPGAVMCYPKMGKDASSSLYDKFSRIAESGRRLGTIVSLVGRLATNQYLNIDQVIQKALDSIQLSVLYSDDIEFIRGRRCYDHE